MSTLESFVWHVLGYSAMPVIFLAGFVAVAGCAVLGLSLTVDKGQD
jgi:uncharacterized protein (TIGR02808 family)